MEFGIKKKDYKERIHKRVLNVVKKLCEEEGKPVPKVRRDNRIKNDGLFEYGVNTITYKYIRGEAPLWYLKHTIYHELGHYFDGQEGMREEREYRAELYAYKMIKKYNLKILKQYIRSLAFMIPGLKTEYPDHYKALTKIFNEIMDNKI